MVAPQTSSKSPPKEETCEISDSIRTLYYKESPEAPLSRSSRARRREGASPGWVEVKYNSQAFLIVSSSGVKENTGRAFSNLSFSNQALPCATRTLSFVSIRFFTV